MDRRTFLARLVAAGAVASFPSRSGAKPPLKVLMLGGRNYVGPNLVKAALAAGHEVTLFNRGQTNPHFFSDLEQLRGDRLQGRAGLKALGTKRNWDVVLDTWAEGPQAVADAAAVLRERTAVYAYVSSIAVYGSFKKVGLTEDDTVAPLPTDLAKADFGYVLNKRVAEHFVERSFGRQGLIVRGSMILGWDETRNPKNQTLYWPIRIRAGGDFVAPGDGSSLVQYTDVGDLAEFVVQRAEAREGGTFNVVAPPLPLRQLIETSMRLTGGAASPVWIEQKFLVAHGGIPFEVVPMWIPEDDPEPGFYRFDNRRAVEARLRVSPLETTIGRILAAYADKPRDWMPDWKVAGGMSTEIERSILQAWRAQQEAT